ncbi:MAG: diguanylate cyclase [Firmicutes bacterium]|nr:diguanylate cyclase [Bacillota bacterium]
MHRRRRQPDLLASWILLLRHLGSLPYGVLLKDRNGGWRFANQQVLQWFGLEGRDWKGKTDWELLSPEAASACAASDHPAWEGARPVESIERLGQQVFHTFKIPLKDRQGRELALLSIISAVNDREQAQREAERLRDFYAALAEVNELVARHPALEPSELLQAAARVLERRVGALLVWIGWVEQAEGRLRGLIPAPTPGLEALYEDLDLSLDPNAPTGQTPAAKAVREGTTEVSLDVESDPVLAFMLQEYRRHGIRAVAAIPIRRFGEVVAVMGVRARDPQFFSAPLLELLEHIALSLGLGLEAFERQRELEQLALYDPLTGLANRRLFFEQLRQACDQARRQATGVGVGMLDLDGFKSVNDTLGHQAGDRLLQLVAARITSLVRQADRVGRMGGDEFAVLLTGLNRAEELDAIARRLLQGLRLPFRLDGESVYISASLGMTYFPTDAGDPSSLLRHADLALYAAKDQGRDQYQLYRAALEEEVAHETWVRHQAAQWLSDGRLEVRFRPLVRLGSAGTLDRPFALEILPAGPEGELLAEALLDSAGLARPLGRFVLEAARRAAIHLREQGWSLDLHVNLGAHYFLDPRFPSDLRELNPPAEPGWGGRLVVEVTEAAPLRDLTQSQEQVATLAELGVAVALDAFGGGSASLLALRHLPVALVKIAPEWTRAALDNLRDQALVAGVIDLARRLGVPAVADGVDDARSLELLARLGCEAVEGEAVGPLLEPTGLDAYLRRF